MIMYKNPLDGILSQDISCHPQLGEPDGERLFGLCNIFNEVRSIDGQLYLITRLHNYSSNMWPLKKTNPAPCLFQSFRSYESCYYEFYQFLNATLHSIFFFLTKLERLVCLKKPLGDQTHNCTHLWVCGLVTMFVIAERLGHEGVSK